MKLEFHNFFIFFFFIKVSVPIVSNGICESMFARAGRQESIPDIFVCAGYENGGHDSCQGDSGGPLQVSGANFIHWRVIFYLIIILF